MVQLSTPYTDPEPHNAHGRNIDDSMMPIADHTVYYSTIS